MTYGEFEVRLEHVKLSKKDFASIVGMHYMSVTNWCKVDKVPQWVISWLDNYERAKTLENVIKAIKPFMK